MKDNSISLYSPRIRFNWGFHDAISDRECGWRNRMLIPEGQLFCLPLHDKAYSDGYDYGQNCDMSKGRPETSDEAWREYQADKKEKAEKRKELKALRPGWRVVRV